MHETEIASFLAANIEPITDFSSKRAYRASAHLRDGTYLPCVSFRKTSDLVDQALREFEEVRRKMPHSSPAYRAIVESFVTKGNRIAVHDVETVEASPFALPARFHHRLQSAGETRMGWLSFTARMDDGQEFWFGSSFNIDFFDMPPGYTADRIVEVHPHRMLEGTYLRDKPFFDCYIEGL